MHKTLWPYRGLCTELTGVHVQDKGWDRFDKDLKKVYGMQKSVREGNLDSQGWPQGHLLAILWGSTKNKLLVAMGHDRMCVFHCLQFAVNAC